MMKIRNFEVLNSKSVREILKLLQQQWGYEEKLECGLLQKENDIFLVTKDVDKIDLGALNVNSIGLYFGEIRHEKLRLSIEGSQIIGKQAKKNVIFEDKAAAENNNPNVKSFKLKKPTSPQKDPIRTNNTNKATAESMSVDQEKHDIFAAKSPHSDKDEHPICPPGFINVLQSRMVFDWFKELMRCREDSIGVGMLLECHSTNFQKSLYFVRPNPSHDPFLTF